MFTLHPQLAKDTLVVGEFDLSLVLLMNDSQFPWCILVPRLNGLRELYELDIPSRGQFVNESCALAATMQRLFAADKMNIAALGNVVPQLHVHHIARFTTDPAWPAPVWGKVTPKPYTDTQGTARLEELRRVLSEQCGFRSATRMA